LAYISAAESIRISSTTFTQSAHKATEFGEIMQPLGLLRRSRSFKVTEFGINRKPICDFLLVINSNLPPILHRFRDIASERSKIATFFYHSLVCVFPDGGVPLGRSPYNFYRRVTDGQGTKWRKNIAENFNRLSRVYERYRRQTTDRLTDRRQTDRRTDDDI